MFVSLPDELRTVNVKIGTETKLNCGQSLFDVTPLIAFTATKEVN
jgi:hypothetical protein